MRGGCLIKAPPPLPGTLLSQNLNLQQSLSRIVFESVPSFQLNIFPYSSDQLIVNSIINFRFTDKVFKVDILEAVSLESNNFVDPRTFQQTIFKMALPKISFVLLLVALMMTASTCQTFQYSRGWTNGKRAENPSSGNSGYQPDFSKIVNFPISETSGQSSDLSSGSQSTHCSLQKLKMLLEGNGNEQIYLLPCDLLNSLQRCYRQQRQQQQQQQQQQDILPAVGHYRRTSSPATYDNNNNNY